jgi:MFS family permease
LTTQVERELDPRRVRSFLGLVLGRLGPRAHGAVAGIFLAFLVDLHTDSLFMVTFALTSHRIITWIANPLAGRWSDHSATSLGRRVPFMGAGLLLAGVCTGLAVHASSYWMLVALLVLTRLAITLYAIPAAAVTPEAFGNSRWLRAGTAVSVGGFLVGLSIRITVIATWDQADVSTWKPAYYLAAAYIIASGLAIIVLVREAPGATRLAKEHRTHDLWSTVRSTLEKPNARVLIASLLLLNACGGAFTRVYPIYAKDVLGAGADTQAGAGLLIIPIFAAVGALGWKLAGMAPRKTLGVLAGVVGAFVAIGHLFIDQLWQSLALTVGLVPFLVAAVIALVPCYLAILPTQGGLGERLGIVISPILLAGMFAALGTGLLYDVVFHDYRAVWIPTGLLGLASGLVLLRLKLPAHARTADPRRGGRILMAILWGRDGEDRKLFRGELNKHEVDGTALLEHVADELNPYMHRD